MIKRKKGYLVDEGMNDSNVSFERQNDDAVRGRDQETPERTACQPEQTDEPVNDAVSVHSSAADSNRRRQNHQHRGSAVDDTLVDDQ